MALYDFQRVLLKLYTSEADLHKFFKEPDSFLGQYKLTDREKKAVRSLPQSQLSEFNHQLLHKRMHIAHKLLESSDRIIALPFNKDGVPILVSKSGVRTSITPVKSGVFELLFALSRKREPLSLSAILKLYDSEGISASFRDLFALSWLSYSKRFIGKRVIVPS